MSQKCTECGESAQEYVIPHYDETGEISDNELLVLCDGHARVAGFCPGCGYHVAGIESDDLSMNMYGLCYDCVEELRIETGEYHDYDESWFE